MSRHITNSEDDRNAYRNRLDSVGRSLDNARMIMKHERRLIRMREQGVKVR